MIGLGGGVEEEAGHVVRVAGAGRAANRSRADCNERQAGLKVDS